MFTVCLIKVSEYLVVSALSGNDNITRVASYVSAPEFIFLHLVAPIYFRIFYVLCHCFRKLFIICLTELSVSRIILYRSK